MPLFIDACTWINLFASGQLEEIRAAFSHRWITSTYVAEFEVITAMQEGIEEPDQLLLSALGDRGVVEIQPVETPEEVAAFVKYAFLLDDGEATVCALASVHGGAVVTDDRKAIRCLKELSPHVPIVQTPQILHEWARLVKPSPRELQSVISNVESLGRFRPRQDAPFAAWWRSFSP
jgi:predicted nucleic acid-binding protein